MCGCCRRSTASFRSRVLRLRMIAKPILFIWGKAINQAAARASQRFNGFGDPLDRLLLVQPKMAEWGQQLKRRSLSGSRRSRAAACPEDARRAAFELCLPGVIWLGCTSNCSANWASVRSPLIAANATFALQAGEWFRRGLLLIAAPDSRAPAGPLSGRHSTYRTVRNCGATSKNRKTNNKNEKS